VPGQDKGIALGGFPAKHLSEGGLADARLTADQHEAAAPSERCGEPFTRESEFAIPPNEERGRWQWRVHACLGIG
jgi:hypothetical protein